MPVSCNECGKAVGMAGVLRCSNCGKILCRLCDDRHECIVRPSRELLHMAAAAAWKERSICKRAKNACVITTADMRQILAFGYNGPARGLPDHSCTGKEGECGCLHAEDNACLYVDARVTGKKAFCTMSPCAMCAQRLVNANVEYVYYAELYRDNTGLEILQKCGIESRQIWLEK